MHKDQHRKSSKMKKQLNMFQMKEQDKKIKIIKNKNKIKQKTRDKLFT